MEVLQQLAGSSGQGILGVLSVGLWALGFLLHLAFGLAAHASAHGRETTFVGPGLWALAALVGGPMVALACWPIDDSSRAATPMR
jgi:hypothetical protein